MHNVQEKTCTELHTVQSSEHELDQNRIRQQATRSDDRGLHKNREWQVCDPLERESLGSRNLREKRSDEPNRNARGARLRRRMSDSEKIKQLRCLLIEALAWLDDYGMRMSGSAGLADRIKETLNDEGED